MGIVTKNPLFLRIDREIHAIRAEVQLLNRAQSYLSTQKADTSGLYPVVLAGAASTIEKIYSGMERCLKMLAQDIDGYVPGGDSWHRDLLLQAAHPVPGIRDASMINEKTLHLLVGLKDFRHRERNLYSRELTADRVITLADETQNALNLFAQDLETFEKKIGGIMPESPPSGPSLL